MDDVPDGISIREVARDVERLRMQVEKLVDTVHALPQLIAQEMARVAAETASHVRDADATVEKQVDLKLQIRDNRIDRLEKITYGTAAAAALAVLSIAAEVITNLLRK